MQCLGLGLGLGLGLLAVSLAGSMAVSDVERLRDFHYRREIAQDEFDTVAGRMAVRSPRVLHFGWLQPVSDQNRTVFEDSPMGLDGQYIREMNADGALVRADTRTLYYPLRWATPSKSAAAWRPTCAMPVPRPSRPT